MNVEIGKLQPGVFGVSHGSGLGGTIIRDATGSWAGHAFLYLGDGKIVEGTSPKARLAPADEHQDAVWAWQMWYKLQTEHNWTDDMVHAAQLAVVTRGNALVGDSYDWPAYLAFTAMVLKLRTGQDMASDFAHDPMRVCSGLVADALQAGGIPLDFVPEDGPSLFKKPDQPVRLPVNLVAPGMLLGLAQRKEWT